ncbi:spore germination protein [Bacillus sp. AFS077874]|uniref:spore germination protein n=1 Tax=unclassified Bacillus (in: firmicutes) TaxID=185979 RepID=UPI000BEC03E0|nr:MULTISPECIES: spore germination protein [unclassified Bacillus (in: firmicutes)]PEC50062.1 spore germination protein [Bacillus sp. AFS096315]PFM79265.1 spore germination protein [Bacillus sp. AFS077874]
MIADRNLDKNESSLRELLFNSSDFKSSNFGSNDRPYRLFYMDTMIDDKSVQEYIIRPLLNNPNVSVRDAVSILDYSETELLSEATNAIIEGKSVVQIDGESKFYLLRTELVKERSVNVPMNERVLRGSHKAFNENLNTNLNIIRNLVATPDLVVKYFQVGRRSNTKVAILYLQSLANDVVLQEFERRLANVDIDYIDAPGFFPELIQDNKFSLFPKTLITERPDRVRSYLMDGKIGFLTDGAPECAFVPISFWAFFQSPDDYQVSWLFGSVLRFLRILCFIFAISLPGIYVALVTFDPRVLPLEFALTLQSSMQYVSMPPVLEAFTMLAILEVLKEATVRLPNPIGQTIGVVGGIVIGTVVVQSNLISNMMVIITALTGIASFIIPSYEMSNTARLLTFPFIVMAAFLGLIGLEISYLFVLTHLSRMNTFGIPYFYNWFNGDTIKDTLFRAPIRSMKKRPIESLAKDETRMGSPKGETE